MRKLPVCPHVSERESLDPRPALENRGRGTLLIARVRATRPVIYVVFNGGHGSITTSQARTSNLAIRPVIAARASARSNPTGSDIHSGRMARTELPIFFRGTAKRTC
jgi:hypothetical protein